MNESLNSLHGCIWLLTNGCIDYIRKKKRTAKQEEELARNWDMIGEVEEGEIMEMELKRLEVLLEEINTEDKTILLMYYQDDFSIKELQDYFDMGASAVKMRLSRARKKFKNFIRG